MRAAATATATVAAAAVLAGAGGPAGAGGADALAAWSAHCLSPFLTAARAAEALPPAHEFYDLRPFSDAAPSPGRDVTPGTDRRCAVTVPGDRAAAAAETAVAALAREGILREAPLPATHAATPGTALLAARALNPGRVAVVHARVRSGPDGPETILSVERLTPEASEEVLR